MIIEKIFLLSCFFPFVSPVPMQTDVQPLAGIFAMFVVFKHNILLNKPFLKNFFFLLLFSFFFLVYNNPFASNFNPDYGKMLSLIFGVMILIAFQYSKFFINQKLLNTIIFFYFIWSLLILISPDIFIPIQNLIVRDTRVIEYSYRGIATLSTEPGLFGGLLIFFFLSVDYCYSKSLIPKNNMYLLKLMIFIMIILTKSGSGYLYFLLYLLFKMISEKISLRSLLLKIFGVAIFFIFIFNLNLIPLSDYGRGFQVLLRFTNPGDILSDTSIFSRLISLSLGFFSLMHYPFGSGNGEVFKVANNLVFEIPFFRSYFMGNKVGFNSSFSYLVISHGVIFLSFIFLLYFSTLRAKFINKFFSAIFFTISYSSAFPAIWILLNLNDERKI